MRINNIFAFIALSFFVSSVAEAKTLPVAVANKLAVELADTVVKNVGVTVEVVSDSTMQANKPKKGELKKQYGTVKGLVKYDKGDAIPNAKLEFISESDTVLTVSSTDGTFSIELLEGEYKLFASYQEQKIKPVDVKVKAGKITEISKGKLEFDAKMLNQVDVLGEKGKRNFNLHICNLAKLPLRNAELHIYGMPDTLKPLKVLYSDVNGNFTDSLLVGNYLIRPIYLDFKVDDINLAIANEDVDLDTIVVNNIRHLNLGELMTLKSRDALISLYKRGIGTDLSPENYSQAYEHWKRSFCARPDRYLVQYLDGIAILNASITADTIQKRYDRLGRYNEELMDLFELAIINIDSLNSQIAGNDTLTVAKLRAQQLEYLRANWQLDTMYRRPALPKDRTIYKNGSWYTYYEVDGKEDSIIWDNELFANDAMNDVIYNMARDIVEAEDLDVEMKDIDVLAKTMFYKFSQDTARVKLAGAREIYATDTLLVLEKARDVFAAISPDDMKAAKGLNAVNFQRGINTRFSEMASWVVDAGDIERLAQVYRNRWNTEGDAVIDQILANRALATNRDNVSAMELYYNALKSKNEKEPTYERLLNVVNRAISMKRYNDVINYCMQLFVEPEFFEETPYRQATMYLRVVDAYTSIGGSMRQKYPYIEKAINACPEYSDAYYYKANLVYSASKRAGLSFCVAYDLYVEAKQKRVALGDNSEIKTVYSAEKIQEQMNLCVRYFPEYMDEHQRGTFGSGDNVSNIGGYKVHAGIRRKIDIPGIGSFNPVVRAIERKAKE